MDCGRENQDMGQRIHDVQTERQKNISDTMNPKLEKAVLVDRISR